MTRDLSLALRKGEILALAGGPGSGKSTLLRSLTGLLPRGLRFQRGNAILDPGEKTEIDLLRAPAGQMRQLRRTRMALLFHHAAGQWNPRQTIRQHIRETLTLAGNPAELRSEESWRPALYEAGLIEPEALLARLPAALTDPILQRFAIALALLKGADLWIADEPTSGLDATSEDQILRLLRELCARHQIGLLLATDHFGVVNRVADRVAVLFEGAIVETGMAGDVLRQPSHPCTRALLDCLPRLGHRRAKLREMDRVSARESLAVADPPA
jgi:peptide/nickel transport system ATP-binding protein